MKCVRACANSEYRRDLAEILSQRGLRRRAGNFWGGTRRYGATKAKMREITCDRRVLICCAPCLAFTHTQRVYHRASDKYAIDCTAEHPLLTRAQTVSQRSHFPSFIHWLTLNTQNAQRARCLCACASGCMCITFTCTTIYRIDTYSAHTGVERACVALRATIDARARHIGALTFGTVVCLIPIFRA